MCQVLLYHIKYYRSWKNPVHTAKVNAVAVQHISTLKVLLLINPKKYTAFLKKYLTKQKQCDIILYIQ